MSEKYILIDRTSKPGKNGVTMWRFTFYNVKDGTVWTTTPDPTYRNWRRAGWDQLSQDPCPWGVYDNIHRTQRPSQKGMGVVSADYRPQLWTRLDNQDDALKLMELRQEELNPPATNYQELFINAQ